MLTMWQQCPAKYHLRKLGWTTRRRSGALSFGGALHEGLAEWYRTGSGEKALMKIGEVWPESAPADDYRNKQKCLTVMLEYMKVYGHEPFKVVMAGDKPLIEVAFTLDTGMYLDCIGYKVGENPDGSSRWELGCGWRWSEDGFRYSPTHGEDNICPKCGHELEPIEYGGIMDGVVEFGPQIYVLEHKSTSQLGPTYFNQFKPNNQVTGYVWAGGVMSGKRAGGAIINAIGVYKAGATKFERKPTSRSDAEIAEWLENVRRECNAIRRCEVTGEYAMRTTACTMYGLCEYHSVHTLPPGTARERRLEQDYVKEHWDYERRDAEVSGTA